MISHPPQRPAIRTQHRHGFSLVEMLLVLAVLGVIAAITWPGLNRMWVNQRINEATEMVRNELAKTRNIAIDATLIYEFRYEIAGNRFLVVPSERETIPEDTGTQQSDGLFREVGTLRSGTQFVSVTAELAKLGIPVIEESVPLADWQCEGLPAAEEVQGLKWSQPILFFPDGSAEQGVVRIQDDFGQTMEITVRGLTGAVSVERVREETL